MGITLAIVIARMCLFIEKSVCEYICSTQLETANKKKLFDYKSNMYQTNFPINI